MNSASSLEFEVQAPIPDIGAQVFDVLVARGADLYLTRKVTNRRSSIVANIDALTPLGHDTSPAVLFSCTESPEDRSTRMPYLFIIKGGAE